MYDGVRGVKLAASRIGVISCEPADQKVTFRGRKRPIKEIITLNLRERGLEGIVHRPMDDLSDFPDVKKCGGLLIGGSRLDIFDEDLSKNEWMRKLLDFIREVHGKLPVLGVCYGHQAVGRAFGAPLKRYGPPMNYEAGFAMLELTEEGKKDLLFKGLPERFEALYSHFSYITEPPKSGVALALSANQLNGSLQSFRVGEATWGVQFHPEFFRSTIRDLVPQRIHSIGGVERANEIMWSLALRKRQDSKILDNFAAIVNMG